MPLIQEAWATIQERYVSAESIRSTELTYGAISGMVDALGDTGHSTFLTPDMVRNLGQVEQGVLKGVGVEIQMKNGEVVVVAPLDNSPAQQAGLRPGDVILKVDGQDIGDWPLSQVVARITGPAGTTVGLTLLDPQSRHMREVLLKRAVIHLHDVSWQPLPAAGIVHVRIAGFDAGVTKDLRAASAQINKAAPRGIILDLRNNAGGLLQEAVGVASLFLKEGNVLLVRDSRGRVSSIPVRPHAQLFTCPLVVLLNNGTASAAEIVAGALKDAPRGRLVGETSFGAGTVLEPFPLSDGSALLLAIEEWLTPNGEVIWHKGVAPQVPVTLPLDASVLLPAMEQAMSPEQLRASSDVQLLRALAILTAGSAPR